MTDKVMYLAHKNPSLTLKLCGKRVQAVNGVFTLTAQQAAELDGLLKTRPDISALVKRVDMEEAAKKAKEFVAKQPPAAVRGVVTSGTSAAAKIREARAAQQPENLTGIANPDGSTTIPTNVITNAKDDKPLQVDQIPTAAPPKGSILSKLAK